MNNGKCFQLKECSHAEINGKMNKINYIFQCLIFRDGQLGTDLKAEIDTEGWTGQTERQTDRRTT